MEAEWGAFDRVRGLYERLLEKTQHVNVFKGYGTFEWRKAENKQRARQVILLAMVENCFSHPLDSWLFASILLRWVLSSSIFR